MYSNLFAFPSLSASQLLPFPQLLSFLLHPMYSLLKSATAINPTVLNYPPIQSILSRTRFANIASFPSSTPDTPTTSIQPRAKTRIQQSYPLSPFTSDAVGFHVLCVLHTNSYWTFRRVLNNTLRLLSQTPVSRVDRITREIQEQQTKKNTFSPDNSREAEERPRNNRWWARWQRWAREQRWAKGQDPTGRWSLYTSIDKQLGLISKLRERLMILRNQTSNHHQTL